MRRWIPWVVASVVLVGCGSPGEPGPEPTRFASPIVGAAQAELFYGAYIDQGNRDYYCGAKYSAGHRGTDILLRSFRVQDSGVTVVAAAAGTVQLIHDGEPDRNTELVAGRPWNFVSIRHPDDVISYYGHLRAGSVRVAPGQAVAAGTPLGLVGSSGMSNWPHLHFEVQEGGVVIDPWEGACQPRPSLFETQLSYQNEFRLLDTGILDRRAAGLADLLERPPDAVAPTGSTGFVTFWAELHNIRAAPLRAEISFPDGSPAAVVEHPVFTTFSVTYVTVTLSVTSDLPPGLYTVVLLAWPLAGGNLTEIARRTFTLAPSAVVGPSLRTGNALKPTLEVFRSGGDAPASP